MVTNTKETVASGIPTMEIITRREVVVVQGAPIYRTVFPTEVASKDGKKRTCTPVTHDFSADEQKRPYNQPVSEYLEENELKAGYEKHDGTRDVRDIKYSDTEAVAWDLGMTDADEAKAQKLADDLKNGVHHAVLNDVYDNDALDAVIAARNEAFKSGKLTKDPKYGWWMADVTDIGKEAVQEYKTKETEGNTNVDGNTEDGEMGVNPLLPYDAEKPWGIQDLSFKKPGILDPDVKDNYPKTSEVLGSDELKGLVDEENTTENIDRYTSMDEDGNEVPSQTVGNNTIVYDATTGEIRNFADMN